MCCSMNSRTRPRMGLTCSGTAKLMVSLPGPPRSSWRVPLRRARIQPIGLDADTSKRQLATDGRDGKESLMARVLVVDDDADVRKLVQVWLRRGGHQVIAVASGAEALETVAAKGPPDVIVADVTMP